MDKDRKLLAVGSAACMAAVATFGVARLRGYPPHEDEVLALFLGRDSLTGMLDTVLTDRGGAPLHYLLAWVVVHLGGGLDALRLVSLACALASISLIAALAWRLIGDARALAAVVLASASWVFLFHAVFGRMYALFLLTTTASFVALAARRWGWWAAAALAGIAAHPYGALVLASQLTYLLLTRARAATRWAMLIVAGALPLCYAYTVLAGRYGDGDGPKSTVGYLREAGGDLSSGYLPVLIAVVALAAIGFTRVRARPLVASAVAGGAVALVLAALTAASPESRHLIFLLPFVATVVAAALPYRRWAVLVVALLVAFELAWAVHRTPELFEGEPAAERRERAAAADWLVRTARPGDVLHGYHPVFLTAWERDRSFPDRVVPRADATLALRELEDGPPGRGVWVIEGRVGASLGLESRPFGMLTVVRSRDETRTASRYLELAEGLLSGIDLQTVREAQRRYDRSSRAPTSDRSTASR